MRMSTGSSWPVQPPPTLFWLGEPINVREYYGVVIPNRFLLQTNAAVPVCISAGTADLAKLM